MLSVADVEKAGRWYQRVLGAGSGHGGPEHEQLLVDGELVLQLHRLEIGHHHGIVGEPRQPVGNGVAVWFEADAFDAAVARLRDADARIVIVVHRNPNPGHREVWVRDRRRPSRRDRGGVRRARVRSVHDRDRSLVLPSAP